MSTGKTSNKVDEPETFGSGEPTVQDNISSLSLASIDPVELVESRSSDCSVACIGNNLYFLSYLLQNGFANSVQCVYIDPPFGTSYRFETREQDSAYKDDKEGEEYLEFLRRRLVLLQRLLKKDGVIFLHLDDNMVFHAKILMDSIFGNSNYLNMIVRRKCSSKNSVTRGVGNISDYILVYGNGDKVKWNIIYEPWIEDGALVEYPYLDEQGRRHKRVPIHAPGVRNGATGQPWRGVNPPSGKHWQYRPEKLEQLDIDGHIYWSKNNNPRRRVYLDESPGKRVSDIWLNFRDIFNQNSKGTGYPTEKNLDLIERLISAASDPGDLVLDAFSGSGTTMVAATNLNRRFIGIDCGIQAWRHYFRRLVLGEIRIGDYVNPQSPTEVEAADVRDAIIDSNCRLLYEPEGELSIEEILDN